jgi:tetratricopeptide (TPR) repeat protein
MMFDYPRMQTYYETLLDKVGKREDSVQTLNLLTRANFFNGDYYAAVDNESLVVKLDSSDARNWMALASYQMMLGHYEKARKNLETARRLDSLDHMIKFNLAVYYRARGMDDSAREMFSQIINSEGNEAQIESRVMLGSILVHSKDALDRKKAEEYFGFVVSNLRQVMENRQLSSSMNFWLGAAYTGLGETGLASNYLNIAKFIETRPFYEGFIELWLGKLADLMGQRDKAKEHYEMVLVLPSAAYHQQEAKNYLEKPYQQ